MFWTRKALLISIATMIVLAIAVLVTPLGQFVGWASRRLSGGATVEQRLGQYGPAARDRLQPFFESASISYPPAKLVLIGIKESKQLEVWGCDSEGVFRHARTYPMLAASGRLGPKLREGDRQVPEGLYKIESLHPNSMFHLALRVNYPNDDDRTRAKADGRSNLGGDIMIHGSNGSVGCLAMGDQAAEDLFVLVADVGLANTELILSPVDFRKSDLAIPADAPAWTASLYSQIRSRLSQFGPR
jgi:hypothetical protein